MPRTPAPAQIGAVTFSPSIPLDVQRALRTLQTALGGLDTTVKRHSDKLANAVTNTPESLDSISGRIRDNLQVNGRTPLNVVNLPGAKVTSIFGRTGIVVASNGDYSAFYDALGAGVAAANAAITALKAALNTWTALNKFDAGIDLVGSSIVNAIIDGLSNTISNVSLATAVIGNLAVTHLNGGTNAGPTTFWRGDGTWIEPSLQVPYTVAGLPGAGAVAPVWTFTRATVFPANFSGSAGTVGANPTAAQTFSVNKNGVQVGTFVIAIAGTFTFTSTGGTAVNFAIGDRMTVTAPTPQDATLSDVSVVFIST